jgi:hypothetical protein
MIGNITTAIHLINGMERINLALTGRRTRAEATWPAVKE